MDPDDDAVRVFPAFRAMSGGLVRLAYPTPHRGSHKGVPLRCVCASLRQQQHGGYGGDRGA